MGAGYASGKFAIALCDQCGQRFKLLQLIKDWKGFKVCEECYEPKHPQLEPKRNITEPQALYQPRPEKRMAASVVKPRPDAGSVVKPPWVAVSSVPELPTNL